MALAPKLQLIKRLNWRFDRRFRLELNIKRENERYDAQEATRQRRHAARLQKLSERVAKLDGEILADVDAHGVELIPPGRRSFATMNGKIQLRTIPEHIVILDKKAIMKKAAALGVIRQIADPPRGGWRLNTSKLLAWLDRNGKNREKFADDIMVIPEHESVTLQPNTGYTVEYSGKRLSPPSITLRGA